MVGKRPVVPVTLLGGWKEAEEFQSPSLVVRKRPRSSSHLAWWLERGLGVPVTLLSGWKEA